jgi:hypothetical protein
MRRIHTEGTLEALTLKELSYKVLLLLALTSASRAHELAALDLIMK